MKEISLGKRTKISQAQQLMLLAVFGTSIFLGSAIAVVVKSINQISFSAGVIAEEEKSIVAFSNLIKDIGICEKPSGAIYSEEELEKCDPNNTDVSSVPDTLRSNILENMAQNAALNSTPNKNIQACINPNTSKNYTYQELERNYELADDEEKKVAATNLIKSCSALRIIPDALPAIANPESLLATVNQIFLDSGTEPKSLAPSEDEYSEEGENDMAQAGTNLYTLGAVFTIEDSVSTITKLLNSAERSIRNFDFKNISMEWKEGIIDFSGVATAYYMGKSMLEVADTSLKPGGQ